MSLPDKGRRILLISPFFYPEEISTGKYNTHLVKALVEKNHSVHVITSYPLYPDWVPKKSQETLVGVDIHRGGLGVRYPKNQVFRRIILELWFAWHSAKHVFKQRNNIDLLVVIFPPVFFMLFTHILLPKRVVRIGIVHDLLGVMATSAKKRSRKIIAGLIRLVESMALKKCDRLVCLSESMRNVIVEKYGISEKKCSVHYPFISTSNTASETNQLSDIFDGDHLHIVYSGALGEKQKPIEICIFFQLLCKTKKNIKCHIFSRGPLFDEIRNSASLKDSNRVFFHDLVPEELLTELYDRSTVHVIPQAEGTSAGAFPSKLPNLIAHGVPIFAICDRGSELATVAAQMEYGRHVDTWDMPTLVEQMGGVLNEIEGVSHSHILKSYDTSLLKMFSVDDLVEDIVQKS
jgi:glycosyltransferase involved in cell wall biosynthesis